MLFALFHATYSDQGLSGMPGFSLGATEAHTTEPAPARGEKCWTSRDLEALTESLLPHRGRTILAKAKTDGQNWPRCRWDRELCKEHPSKEATRDRVCRLECGQDNDRRDEWDSVVLSLAKRLKESLFPKSLRATEVWSGMVMWAETFLQLFGACNENQGVKQRERGNRLQEEALQLLLPSHQSSCLQSLSVL